MGVKTFQRRIGKDADYLRVAIGERTMAEDGSQIVITNIIRVSIEPDGVYIHGYGVNVI